MIVAALMLTVAMAMPTCSEWEALEGQYIETYQVLADARNMTPRVRAAGRTVIEGGERNGLTVDAMQALDGRCGTVVRRMHERLRALLDL